MEFSKDAPGRNGHYCGHHSTDDRMWVQITEDSRQKKSKGQSNDEKSENNRTARDQQIAYAPPDDQADRDYLMTNNCISERERNQPESQDQRLPQPFIHHR